jgi:hypothetical protein
MEEILSSIRRIIADEESEERDADETEHGDAQARSEDDGEGEDDDDVLELTEVVREDDEVVDRQAAHEPDVGAETSADEQLDEGPDDRAEVGDEVELLPSEEAAQPEETLPEETLGQETLPEETLPEAPPAMPERPPAVGEGLISAATAGATAGAFAKLNQAMHHDSEGEAPVPESDRSIEAFLADLLRPMLREWLEENLPPMVERLVAQEIEKLAKRAELL